MEERGRKRKKKKVVRFEPVVPRENASRICYFIEDKNEEEIRRIREGEPLFLARRFQAVASLQNNSNENILVRGFHGFLLA